MTDPFSHPLPLSNAARAALNALANPASGVRTEESHPLDQAMTYAQQHDLTLSDYLKAHLALNEQDCADLVAHYLSVGLVGYIDADQLLEQPGLDTLSILHRITTARTKEGLTLVTIDTPGLRQLRALCRRAPDMRHRIAAISRQTLREQLSEQKAPLLARRAMTALHRHDRTLSAHRVMTHHQKLTGILGLILLAMTTLLFPAMMLIALNVLLVMAFLSVALLRLDAAFAITKAGDHASNPATHHQPSNGQFSDRQTWPIYTILLPLYDEAEMVPGLLTALKRLNYPKHRLDIKVLIEAEDQSTWDALQAYRHRLDYDVIRLADIGPRTKPKALNAGLRLARGEYVVVYDAEDRPEPDQLLKALDIFEKTGPDLACLQARLDSCNLSDGWLARQFAIEYAALFHGLLADLSTHELPMPLGGTSNHFRKSVLEALGGWDPHNVTEDADLGMRLARSGYHCRLLASSTVETAPTRLSPWVKQRARWFKGWMQTWLVHMRHPLITAHEMGLSGFVFFQIMIGGMLLAALIHPFFVLVVIHTLFELDALGAKSVLELGLFNLNVINLIVGYGAAILLAYKALPQVHPTLNRRAVFGLPVYWFLMSAGAYLALWDLITRPHHWHKTPHHSTSVMDEISRKS